MALTQSVTRKEWGANPVGRRPVTVPTKTRQGVVFHWIGSPCSQPAHTGCDDLVRSVQHTHQAGNGWSDVAYSFIVCQHGYIYTGRGWRWDQFANGETTRGDLEPTEGWVTVLFLIGGNEDGTSPQHPSHEAKRAARRLVLAARRRGAGLRVMPHNAFHPKACPGNVLEHIARRWNGHHELTTRTHARDDNKPPAPAVPEPSRPAPVPHHTKAVKVKPRSRLWRALSVIAREWVRL